MGRGKGVEHIPRDKCEKIYARFLALRREDPRRELTDTYEQIAEEYKGEAGHKYHINTIGAIIRREKKAQLYLLTEQIKDGVAEGKPIDMSPWKVHCIEMMGEGLAGETDFTGTQKWIIQQVFKDMKAVDSGRANGNKPDKEDEDLPL